MSDTENDNSGNQNGGNQIAPAVHAARISKFPTFRHDYPEFWISQVESTFRNHDIARDQTKFDYVIQYAPPEVYPHIASLAMAPPAEGKYEAIKKKILDAFSVSEEAKIRQVLQSCNIGNQKPSHFLQELRNKAGTNVSEPVLKSIFVEQLPEHVRFVIAADEERTLDTIARMADRIVDMRQGSVIAATSKHPVIEKSQLAPQSRSEMSEIIARLDKIETAWKQSRRDKSEHRRERSKSRPREDKDNSICYYHSKYGNKARKCTTPCTWVSKPAEPEN